jgi:chemotaxis protein CheZ
MSDTQTRLGNALLKRLIVVRQQKGNLQIEDVGAILEGMAQAINGDQSQPDRFVKTEIEKMANYIVTAKAEVFSMVPEETSPKNIGNANNQLDAVVKATEQATNTIMDAADNIQNIMAKAPAEIKNKIEVETVKIYDACTFQDITGQRITKVIGCLQFLEEKIGRLITLFGDTRDMDSIRSALVAKKPERKDEHLLGGPSLPGEGPSQQEIDALFANLK